eukprot:1698962-Ditylum_brightwellii.AAC.1
MGPTLGAKSVHGNGADNGKSSSNETYIINAYNDTNTTDTGGDNNGEIMSVYIAEMSAPPAAIRPYISAGDRFICGGWCS